jgi:hypothetical protein
MTESDQGREAAPTNEPLSEPVRVVLAALNSLKFGAIQLTVHEGRLVQVDITERKRFTN